MNIELFCKALSVIYSKRFGMKVTVTATTRKNGEADESKD